MSVCVSVSYHVREPCKKLLNRSDADCRVDSGGPKELCISRIQIPQGEAAIFGGCLAH